MISLSAGVADDATEDSVTGVPAWTTPGRDVYRRGLVLALDQAARRSFPDSRLWVEHALSLGYKCRLEERPSLSSEEIVSRLTESLEGVVREDLPIRHELLPKAGDDDVPPECLDLARWRSGDRHLSVNRLLDSCAFALGPAVTSTGLLETWELRSEGSGFVLRFPGSASWPRIGAWMDRPNLAREFDLQEKHLARMRVRTIDELNRRIEDDGGREVVIMSHFYQQYRLVQIVMALQASFPEKRIVTIAGPSSSGKTTFSRLLCTSLIAQGFNTRIISVDNYFKNRSDTPVDSNGNYDFECLEALETEMLGRDLSRLLEGDEVLMPRFDFQEGVRVDEDSPMKLEPNDILLIEGIHGLNDDLTPGIPAAARFRIYVSALTQLNVDRLTRMSTSDSRLLRRVVRDSSQRGYTAEETILNWPSVRRGERRFIFPYQERADAMFNSALPYELPVLRPYASALLESVPAGSEAYHAAASLLDVLSCVRTIESELVPRDSLLREFIGGSLFSDSED
jgi:uridine kinase